MGLQVFFNSFTVLVDAPNGVQRIRDLTLQLAIQGRLDTHNQSDEAASDLLERINLKRTQLFGETGTKQNEVLSPKSNDEALYILPSNWKLARLGEVQVFTNGYAFKSSDYQPDGIGIVRIGDIQNGEISKQEMRYVSPDFLKSLDPKFQVNKGDLLIAMSGATTGKLGFNKTDDVFLLNQRVGRFEFIEVLPAYGFFFLSTKISENLRSSSGSAIPNLSTEQINNIPFPLPPVEEQRRIVAKVDCLMRLCDELEARHQARRESRVRLNNVTLAPLNNAASLALKEFEEACERLGHTFATLYDSAETVSKLRATILQLAVHGKLISQDPSDEPASGLLKEIRSEKERQIREKKSKQIESILPITENDALLPSMPKGWAWAWLGDLARFVDYRGKTPPKTETGVKLITAKNVKMGFISEQPREFISEATYAEVMTRGFPMLGDILFTTEAPLGNVAQLLTDERIALAQRVIDLQPFKPLFSEYLKTCLMSPLMQQAIVEKATGMTATGIKASKLRLIPVPVPPLEEQKRIVAKVNQLMALCDELEAKLRKAESDSEKVMNAAVRHVLSSTTYAPDPDRVKSWVPARLKPE